MSEQETHARGSAHGPVRTFLGVALVALLLGGVVASCSAAPQAVLNVPGNYVADLWAPTLDHPSGNAFPTIVMCLDAESAVQLGTGDGGQGGVGVIILTWAGVEYSAPATGDPTSLTTPVLQPGCGTLKFGPDCCHVDNFLAIKATKV